jgi:hypothetical protein
MYRRNAMTSHSLPSQAFRPAQPLGLGKTLRHLAVATTRFTVALLNALRRPNHGSRRLSLVEEANELRVVAANYVRTDPGFAADLMAAADRHELGAER